MPSFWIVLEGCVLITAHHRDHSWWMSKPMAPGWLFLSSADYKCSISQMSRLPAWEHFGTIDTMLAWGLPVRVCIDYSSCYCHEILDKSNTEGRIYCVSQWEGFRLSWSGSKQLCWVPRREAKRDEPVALFLPLLFLSRLDSSP